MRPEELLDPTPAGLCCRPGGFHIDPTRPVARALITHGHSDHARPGTAPCWRRRRRSTSCGCATAKISPARLSPSAMANAAARRRDGELSSGRPCARLGADPGRGRRPAHRGLGRLQGRGRSDLPAVRAGGLRRLHHRGDVRPAGVSASAIPTPRSPSCCVRVALFPERAHLVGAYSLGKAQRVIALLRAAGYDKPIYLHGAMETITRYYASPAWISARCGWRATRPRPTLPAPS